MSTCSSDKFRPKNFAIFLMLFFMSCKNNGPCRVFEYFNLFCINHGNKLKFLQRVQLQYSSQRANGCKRNCRWKLIVKVAINDLRFIKTIRASGIH